MLDDLGIDRLDVDACAGEPFESVERTRNDYTTEQRKGIFDQVP